MLKFFSIHVILKLALETFMPIYTLYSRFIWNILLELCSSVDICRAPSSSFFVVVSFEMTNGFRPPTDRRIFPVSSTSCFRFPFEKFIVNVCRGATQRLFFLRLNYGLSKLVNFRTVGAHIERPHKTALS